MDSNFEEIFQGWLDKEELFKPKGFLKKNKSWKKYFCVLRRYDGDDNVYFQWFEKEEDWRKEFPVGSFSLFPKYSVYKRKTEKGKSFFEVSNDEEYHYFMASNEKTMDLWVIQLMMQTTLNSSMIGNSFRVKGSEGKGLQRIGAKNLNCLLHVSEWGVTLALERTHSVLSQWPLTTIRNYECTDDNEFVFEAGRKSPMGEGKYTFLTNNNEDNDIFDQIDRYTSLRAKRARSSGNRNRLMSGDEEEIAEAYGKLRWSVMLNSSTLNLGVISPISSAPKPIVQNDDQLYNHLQRRDSSQSTATTAICGSYDHLERASSFNDNISRTTTDTSYSRLNMQTPGDRKGSRGTIRGPNDSYDHLERTGSFNDSSSSFETRSKSLGSNDGRNRFQFSSPPLEDSYNHLDDLRRGSTSPDKRPSVARSPEEYNRLDRSTMSVQQGVASSYDRLDAMQDNVFAKQGLSGNQATSPPTTNDPSAAYDLFNNNKNHEVRPYNFAPFPSTEVQNSATEELPPPLPQKPSFMKQSKMKEGPENKQETKNLGSVNETNNGSIPTEPPLVNGTASFPQVTEDQCQYQDLDEATGGDSPKPRSRGDEFDRARPRSRLNTHSSDTDLRKLSMEKSHELDPSKRTTLHRSAPSLALYSVVNKKKTEKGLAKGSSSTFKLDSFFKRIGRGSKKEETEGSYEKIPQKSKKSRRKMEKGDAESTSSLRRLVTEDDDNAYAEINEDGSLVNNASKKMERSESSKRPLPELPLASAVVDV